LLYSVGVVGERRQMSIKFACMVNWLLICVRTLPEKSEIVS